MADAPPVELTPSAGLPSEVALPLGPAAGARPARHEERLTASQWELLERRARDWRTQPETVAAAALAALYFRFTRHGRVVCDLRSRRLSCCPTLQSTFASLVAQLCEGSADTPEAGVDWRLELLARPRAVVLRIEYQGARLDRPAVTSFGEGVPLLLQAALESPELSVADLPVLTRTGRRRLARLNATGRTYPSESRVEELVAAQVDRSPDAIAVAMDGVELTYAALDARAEELSVAMRHGGVSQGSLVGVNLPRSIDAIVCLYAILKCGAGYVPIDPTYPIQRQQLIADDSRPALIVTSVAEQQKFGTMHRAATVEQLGTGHARWGAEHTDDARRPVFAEDVAYVLYTSGSTGQPKGVVMPHRPLVNLLCWQNRQDGMAAPRRTLQFASLCFDVSFQEIFSTWTQGGTLLLVEEAARRDPRLLFEYCAAQRAERLFLPVVAFQYLAERALRERRGLPHLREVITAGEQLEITPAVESFFAAMPGCRLFNHYGPTETHVVTSYEVSDRTTANRLPSIGRPIDNVQVHILDEQGQVAPVGVPGELWLAGDALAREYLGQPELTQERFVHRTHLTGGRMYRTGDLVQLQPDGNLQFLGRADRQVKIRGFRVEPGEISAAIEQLAEVAKAVVVPVGDARREQRLIGFVVPRDTEAKHTGRLAERITQHLRRILPDYMRPARIELIDRLPLSPNGKVETARLVSMVETDDRAYVPPRTPLELQLARIWEEVLDLCPIGADAHFFDLGGDSLRAAAVSARVESTCQVDLPVAQLVAQPVLQDLAASLQRERDPADWSPLVPLQPEGRRRPLFVMHPAGGNVLCYLRLAHALGEDQPVYGLQSAGIDGIRPPLESIEAMAASYIAALRQVQPHGPYALAGWSLGGTLAFEMARQLRAAGEAIASLVIVDMGISYSFRVLRTLFPDDAGGMTGMLRGDSDKLLAWFREQTAATQIIPPEATNRQAERVMRTFHANIQALLDYRPGPYAGKLTLLLGDEPLVRCRRSPADEWRDLGADVELHTVGGNHLTVIQPPHVEDVARIIQQVQCRDFKSVA